MSVERKIPKDSKEFENKFVFGMTPRQVLLLIPSAALAIGSYFLLNNIIPIFPIKLFISIILGLPLALFGWVKPYGQPLEVFLKSALVSNLKSPVKRFYKIKYSEFEQPLTVQKNNSNTSKEEQNDKLLYSRKYHLIPKDKRKRVEKPASKNKNLRKYK